MSALLGVRADGALLYGSVAPDDVRTRLRMSRCRVHSRETTAGEAPSPGARMPTYDFRCRDCGHPFELTRSFGRAGEPALCPLDGTVATRLYTPPMDLLFYRREPVASTERVTIPPGALSCHDHGPPPGAPADHEHEASGSRWHARGYEPSEKSGPEERQWHSHAGGLRHAHAHGRSHTHGGWQPES